MAQKLVVASHNEGKVREIRALLAPLGFEVVSAAELGLPEPEETGITFEENAILKAKAAALASGHLALADDSGLCVPALDDAPGIYSARWAGPSKEFNVAMTRIESELSAEGVTPTGAAAYFVCALTLAYPDGRLHTERGEVHGTLTFPPRGLHGFGYDPIFIPAHFEQTFGEMDPTEKHAMSHRARAFEQLINHLVAEHAA